MNIALLLVVALISGLFLLNRREGGATVANTAQQSPVDDIAHLEALIRHHQISYPLLQGIPASVVLAVISIESNFTPTATNSAGEQGLMQIRHPLTWNDAINRFRLSPSLLTTDPTDPSANILVGMSYLWLVRRQLAQSGVAVNDWPSIVEAYNVGPTGWLRGSRNSSHKNRFIRHWARFQADA